MLGRAVRTEAASVVAIVAFATADGRFKQSAPSPA